MAELAVSARSPKRRPPATITKLAERLHTLGLGPDAAYAQAETASWDEAEARLLAHGGRVRPGGAAPRGSTCPTKGSLESLKQRYSDDARRFLVEGKAILFVNAAKPRFRQVTYDSPPQHLLFDLVGDGTPWPLNRIAELTDRVRDRAAEKLESVLDDIHNVIVGRRDAGEADKAARLRITPLPSIGHRHADHAIRRILVEIPPNCPLRADDVAWAFSGLLLVSADGEIIGELAPAVEHGMLAHYGIGDAEPARLWRTVTPAALPQAAARRRIDPIRLAAETRSGAVRLEVKGGKERAGEECRAVDAVAQALRHSGVSARLACAGSARAVRREGRARRGLRARNTLRQRADSGISRSLSLNLLVVH